MTNLYKKINKIILYIKTVSQRLCRWIQRNPMDFHKIQWIRLRQWQRYGRRYAYQR